MSDQEKFTPFTYLNGVNTGNKNIEIDDSVYNQFLMNRGLSLFIDTIAIANEANRFKDINNKMHYDFLVNVVSPRKRFSKWPKPKSQPDAAILSQYYNISMVKAYDLLRVMDKEDIEKIKMELDIA